VTTVDKRGNMLIVGVGDVGPTPEGATERRAFDSQDFDPSAAAAFIRYWSAKLSSELRGRSRRRIAVFGNPTDITWPGWLTVPDERRGEFLRDVVRGSGQVDVNGHVAARWHTFRALLGLGPKVEPNA